MKPQKVKELSIVEIEWQDSTHIAGWQYREQDYAFVASQQRSIGQVVHNDSKGEFASIVITTTVGAERDTRSKFGGVHTPFSIPWCCIYKFRVIETQEKK